MILTEIAPAAALPVPLREFAAHIRLGTGFEDDGSEDALLEVYLRAAAAAIEARTGKALVTRRLGLQLTRWRAPCAHGLPVAPVAAVETVRLIDELGAATEVDATRWTLVPDAQMPQLVGARGGTLPTIPINGRAEITFQAGFGPSWNDVPSDLRQAVMLLAASYYEQRAEVGGGMAKPMPFGVAALLEPHCAVRM
ncbi:MAG: head-tail connector protein [Pseudomonadota bacterium]